MANTVSTNGASDYPDRDNRHTVVKAAFYAVGGLASGIATILVVAGTWNIADETVRFALTILGIVAALAQLTAAVYIILTRRRR